MNESRPNRFGVKYTLHKRVLVTATSAAAARETIQEGYDAACASAERDDDEELLGLEIVGVELADEDEG